MGHNKDVVSICRCLLNLTLDMEETSLHYISISSFQYSRRVLKP